MGTTIEKLTKVLETKEAIRTAINNKGGTLTESDTFSSYSAAIDNIQTGGGENPLQYIIDNQGGDGKPSCQYLFYKYKGSNLDNLLSTLDFSKVASMDGMFSNCTNLTSIPLLDTSNVTDMSMMFYECSSLTSIPQLDTSKVTNMSNAFYDCSSLTSFPLLDTSNVTSMYGTFSRCSKLSSIPTFNTSNATRMDNMFENCFGLISIPLLDTSKVTDMGVMFSSCNKLTSIPKLNTSKVTNMNYMFQYCSNLTTIPQLDVSKVTGMFDIFKGCSKLSEIHMTGIKANLNISSSSLFTRDALLEILNNLSTIDGTKTLTMGSTNLSKLTDEDKAIATNKGWTLA